MVLACGGKAKTPRADARHIHAPPPLTWEQTSVYRIVNTVSRNYRFVLRYNTRSPVIYAPTDSHNLTIRDDWARWQYFRKKAEHTDFHQGQYLFTIMAAKLESPELKGIVLLQIQHHDQACPACASKCTLAICRATSIKWHLIFRQGCN